jgi:hypothetical protein
MSRVFFDDGLRRTPKSGADLIWARLMAPNLNEPPGSEAGPRHPHSFLWSSEHAQGATAGACVTGLFFSVRFAPDINVCHAWPHGGCRAKLN